LSTILPEDTSSFLVTTVMIAPALLRCSGFYAKAVRTELAAAYIEIAGMPVKRSQKRH